MQVSAAVPVCASPTSLLQHSAPIAAASASAISPVPTSSSKPRVDQSHAPFREDPLSTEVERFLATNDVDTRAEAALRMQAPTVQRAVLDRGHLHDAQNPSAALMSRIQIATDHLAFMKQQSSVTGGSSSSSGGGCSQSSACPEVEEFIRDNVLDDKAARELRDADPRIQQGVLSLGRINNCTNPSAICIARIRAARSNPMPTDRDGSQSQEMRDEVERFLQENEVDQRAATVLRAQGPDVQRAVLDRGDLTDCDNQSTALMGRIKVAIDAINFERNRKRALAASGNSGERPQACSPQVEEFIRDNDLDEMAARQLREVDSQIQELVLDRGSLDGVRNPSAVIRARIREAKETQMEEREKEREKSRNAATPSTTNTEPVQMVNPMMGLMVNPMMMPTLCSVPMMNMGMMMNPMMMAMQPSVMAPMSVAGFPTMSGTPVFAARALHSSDAAAGSYGSAPPSAAPHSSVRASPY